MISNEAIEQALFIIIYEPDKKIREKSEAYLNSLLKDKLKIVENTKLFTSLLFNRKFNLIIPSLLKKLIPLYKYLEEIDIVYLFNNYNILINFDTYEKVGLNVFENYLDFFTDFFYDVVSFDSNLGIGFITEAFLKLAEDFTKNEQRFFIKAFMLERILKKINLNKIVHNKIFQSFFQKMKDFFYQFKEVVKFEKILLNEEIIFNHKKSYLSILKIFKYLCESYYSCEFLEFIYKFFFRFFYKKEIQYLNNSNFFFLYQKTINIFNKTYAYISTDKNFSSLFLTFLINIFMDENNFEYLKNICKNDLCVKIYYSFFKLLTNFLEDFLLYEGFSINYNLENGQQIFIEEFLKLNFSKFLPVIENICEIFILQFLESCLDKQNFNIDFYFKIEKNDIEFEHQKTASRFIGILYNFYYSEFSDELEQNTIHLKNRIIEDLSKSNLTKNFYFNLFFLEENLNKIHKSLNVDPIVEILMQIKVENQNLIFLKFLNVFYIEYDISASIIQKGIVFLDSILYSPNLVIRFFSIKCMILIGLKLKYREDCNFIINWENYLFEFFDILKNVIISDLDCITDVLNCFADFFEVVDNNEKWVSTLITSMIDVISYDFNHNKIGVLQKVSEVFSDIYLNLPADQLSNDILGKAFFLIELIINMYKQDNEEPIYLDFLIPLILSFIAKFEIKTEQAILNILQNKDNNNLFVFDKFLNFMEKQILSLFPLFYKNLKQNEMLGILFITLNIYHHLLFITNKTVITVIDFEDGETSCCLNYKIPHQKNLWIKTSDEESQFSEKILTLEINNVNEIKYDFIKNLLNITNELMIQLIADKEWECLNNSFSVFEFGLILFPFINNEILEKSLFFFKKIFNDQLLSEIEKSNLFFSINRILARVFYNNTEFDYKLTQENFDYISFYLNHLSFAGR